MKDFTTVYKKLNPHQKKAVDSIEGPVMVVAGPGTGKTQVLAARIANILKKTDTPPYSILALTFTESAAANMRERVVGMIGQPGYYVNVSTFHAFCTDVIRTHPEYFPIERGGEPLSELERYDIFQNIIQKQSLHALKPINTPLFYLTDITNAISQLKKEGIYPDEFQNILDNEFNILDKKMTKTQEALFVKNRKKNYELAKVYKMYQKELRDRKRFDFDDMIALVAEAFLKEKLLLREYQEEMLYFLVDEYQDTNSAQNKIVELLASYWGQKANLFVVGDPNQSIFRFQGASLENTLAFIKRFPKAEIINLNKGYRTSQCMYDAAHNLIANNTLTDESGRSDKVLNKLSQKLTSEDKSRCEINLASLPSQTLEAVYIAEEVKKLMKAKVPPEQIAVLYRNNKDVIELKDTFEKWSIPYEIDGGMNILETELIRQLFTFFKVILDVRSGTDHGDLYEVLSYDWINIDSGLVMKGAYAAGKAKISLYELVLKGYEHFAKYYPFHDVSKLEFHILEEWIRKIQDWGLKDFTMTFPLWFETIMKESGLLDWILHHPAKIEYLTHINSLFKEIKALAADHHDLKLEQFLLSIQTMRDHRLQIQAEEIILDKGSVHFSTVHKAKGREWDYVFIMRCVDGKWGNNKIRELIKLPEGLLKNTDVSKKEKNEDERRLFYVALTRVRKQLYITHPEKIVSDYTSRNVIRCMFIDEIGKKYFQNIYLHDFIKKAERHLELLLEPKTPYIKITDYEFFRRLVQKFKLSVTALNTYLKDPQEFVENTLLRVPRAKPEHMAFGTAIHKALERFYSKRMEGKEMSLQNMIKIYEQTLKSEVMYEIDFERRLNIGKELLEKYYERYGQEKADVFYVERLFGYGFRKAVLGDISLTGRIDRVDWIDKNKRLVRVIDYKTGRSRSVNEIEGKVKSLQLSKRERNLPENLRGSYKRQLLFYKLLTELDQTFIPEAVEGMFDFVQPSETSGNFTRRLFVLKKEDVNDLKKLIKEVMEEIRELKFLE